jgi:hypothetical protein
MDMDESEGEEGEEGSDDDSVNADGTRSGKKKKSQRFFCTEYPPCALSFTRSEHLARHIRKHTGERPFQCHCSRRFSRLDNLRQHAQTVHVNEDIPIDSLAATGSRFQRQLRTDRVRQAGNRARASTGGSAGGPIRGHSKSLSTSSIASVGSVGSTYGVQSMDPKRRPPPLVMADPRHSSALDPYRSGPERPYTSYGPPSPGDFSAPPSATFSNGPGSPRWGPMASPTSSHSHSRSHSMFVPGSRTPNRRLSVPSGVHPFQAQHGMQPSFGPPLVNSSHAGAFSPSSSSLLSSPTTSTSGWSGRRDSISSISDEAWRRRTWHPDSRNYVNNNNNNPNQLSNVVQQSVRTNAPPPIAVPSAPQAGLRLPGIESFDPIPHSHSLSHSHRPITPPRHNGSPMMIDSSGAPRPLQPPTLEAQPTDERRNLNMYDAGLQRKLNRLDISHSTPPRDSAGAWASEVNRAVQAQAEQVRMNPPTVRFEEPPSMGYSQGAPAGRPFHQHTMSAPSASMRESKRHGWYHGPSAPQNPPIPEQRTAHVDRIVHPNFQGFNGFPARDQPPQPGAPHQQDARTSTADPLGRLEALVAVATSESSTATAC